MTMTAKHSKPGSLVVVETHPIQYHAPVYRAVQESHGIPVEAIYGSDFSVAGYRDEEFRSSFAWDVDLLSGTRFTFLSKVSEGGAASLDGIACKGLARAIRGSGAGAVLLTGYRPSFHLAALLHTWRRGYPILFRAETTDHAVARDAIKSGVRDRGLRTLYSLCDRVLPVGSRSYDHYRRLGVAPQKLVFAPYCVDTAPFRCGEDARTELRPDARARLGVAEEDTAILFSGKLSKRKGVHLLVAAVKSLDAGVRDRIVLVFLGDGEERWHIAESCGAAPVVRAVFPGFQNQTLLSPYYHAADMLVLPSIAGETWGLVVNEALHHGIPCVVSDAVGCAPDLVEPAVTGDIADTGSPASLAQAIQRALRLVKDPDVRSACRRRAATFSVQKAAAGIAEAFWSVAPGARPSASAAGVAAANI